MEKQDTNPLKLKRAVFLDRDGVINQMVYNPDFGIVDSPANPDEFFLITGVGRILREIKRNGFLTILISNQPGVAKGKYTQEILAATTTKMHKELKKLGAKLDAEYYCMHHSDAVVPEYKRVCDCRKPKPGLILCAAREWDIDLGNSYFVGDGINDVLAGQSAGVKTILVSSKKLYIYDALNERKANPNYIVKNLSDAEKIIKEGKIL